MDNKKENKKRKITFTDIIIVIVILLLFSIIIIQYYKSVRMYVFNETESEPVFTRYSNFTRYANFSGMESEYKSLNISEARSSNRAATSVVVLNHHGVFANDTGLADYSGISYDRFKDQMFALKKAGYETINMEDLYLFLRGKKQLPEKSLMLTFDDGIKDSYYNADPILKLLNYTAVMFVITSQSIEKNNSKYYLNTDELHQMQNSGRWDIESHSYNAHGKVVTDEQGSAGPYLTNKIWIANEGRLETDQEYFYRVQNDLRMAKEQLEKEFNKTILGFALPYGDFGQRETNYPDSERIILDIEKPLYAMVFYQFKPVVNKDFRANFNNDPEKDFYLVMRISADYISTDNLLNEIEAAQFLDIPYTEKFDNPRRWINIWNQDISISEDRLNIINTYDVYGGMAYLDGSYLWKDYIYSGTIGENGSDKVLLLSRFQNSGTYVACKYTNKSVSIINVRNRVIVSTSQINLIQTFPGLDVLQSRTKLSISVVENNVGCYVNNNVIIEQDVPDIPPFGGIGIRVEGLPANKSVTLASIRVEYPYYGD